MKKIVWKKLILSNVSPSILPRAIYYFSSNAFYPKIKMRQCTHYTTKFAFIYYCRRCNHKIFQTFVNYWYSITGTFTSNMWLIILKLYLHISVKHVCHQFFYISDMARLGLANDNFLLHILATKTLLIQIARAVYNWE